MANYALPLGDGDRSLTKNKARMAASTASGATETDMMQQYRRVKQRYPDALLFFRFGDFYEMFYHDAELASRALDIMLTARPQGKAKERVPMCGVPHHRLEPYVARLIEKGHKVAICEQLEAATKGKGLVQRDVIRVVTPGTFFESERQDGSLVALLFDGDSTGLAFLRLSTGEFLVSDTTRANVKDVLARLRPQEVLIQSGERLEALAHYQPLISERPADSFMPEQALATLRAHFGHETIDSVNTTAPRAMVAAGVLLGYVQQTQMAFLPHLQAPQPYDNDDIVILDAQTQRNLELVENLFHGTQEGSLFMLLDCSCTSMGRRRLKHWLLHPLRSVASIQARQDAIAELVAQSSIRNGLREILDGILDLARLTSRVSSAAANPRDLAALRTSLASLPQLYELLQDLEAPLLQHLLHDFDSLQDIHDEIQDILLDEPKAQARDGGLIRKDVSTELDELHVIQRDGSSWLAGYEQQQRERTGIPNLKAGFNKVFGYYIEITKSRLQSVPDDYLRRQTLVNAERFITDALKQFEQKAMSANERSKELEYDLFVRLRDSVATQASRLRHTADILGQLDAMAALSEVAVAKRWNKPQVNDGHDIRIHEGRHPVVEALSGSFVPNDLLLQRDAGFMLLTGPNAAGKSTYARQAAVLILLAQIGSYVPADEAVIGVVDRIFTRVGAADFLARGLSTFMVEMMETANILRYATDRSLVILDEVGRGTGSTDGQAIAQAIAETLARDIKAKTLFTTHYHQLAQLADHIPGIVNARLAVREEQDEVAFLYKVIPGAAQRSYGIYVARLAGLPEPILQRANELLSELEQQAHYSTAEQPRNQPSDQPSRETSQPQRPTDPVQQKDKLGPWEDVIAQLLQTDPLHTTPMEALDLLAELRKRVHSVSGHSSRTIEPEPTRVTPLHKKPIQA